MRMPLILSAACLVLTGCASHRTGPSAAALVAVKLIAFNDFHGNLSPPRISIEATDASGAPVRVAAGGVAYLASAIDNLRAQNPNHAVVSAGDMIGATPINSALFLDEPTILAMNMIGVDFNAAGNHEFDKGRAELLRIQGGGCAQYTRLEPCRVDKPYPGAAFPILTANTITETGLPLLAPTGLKSFGKGKNRVTIGFIGLTLTGTPNLVSPSGVAGLTFADEAATANALIPALKAEGADAIVVLIHQGLYTAVGYNDKSCGGMSGDLMAVLDKLDPAVDVVISGHTHVSYVCDYAKVNPARPFLVTSAGKNGMFLSDIRLTLDPVAGRVLAKSADNLVVQSEAFQGLRGPVALRDDFPKFSPRADLAALVARYDAAAKQEATRIVGRMSGAATTAKSPSRESLLGNLIADSQLAATAAADKGGAQIALMNPDGLRVDIVPGADGTVTFGSLFAAQPFSNAVMVKTMTTAQIRAVLEQQFNDPQWTRILSPSQGFRFSYDMSKPEGQRILAMSLNGMPLAEDGRYRVAMNSFLASGGDKFSVFKDGTEAVTGPLDIDALIGWLSGDAPRALPALDRVTNLTPQ
ncbi:MAG: bifunctional metallophosphatase/5'-nucleotidase [Sphingomonadales bacterium]|nr:bifunctional metallophosphatase/5'-nucleotidase [Sphingomonadales bacterium]